MESVMQMGSRLALRQVAMERRDPAFYLYLFISSSVAMNNDATLREKEIMIKRDSQ